MYALNPIDYDNVTLHIDAVSPDASMEALYRAKKILPPDGESYWVGLLSRDIYVTSNSVRTKVSGSPHKHVRGESVGVFGPAEMRAFIEDVAGRLGLPLQAVLNARVTRLDVSVNFHVEHHVPELLRLLSAPPQMEEVVFRTGTKAFQNSLREINFYDKVQKLLDQGNAALVPAGWEAGRVLRAEVKFLRVSREFGRTVTAGDLCTQAFYEEASARWLRWVSAVGVRDGVWVVPRGGRTVPELRDSYAEAGLVLTGGNAAAGERINALRRAGELTSAQASRQRKWVGSVIKATVTVEIASDTATIQPTIASTFKDAVEAAASLRPRTCEQMAGPARHAGEPGVLQGVTLPPVSIHAQRNTHKEP